MGRVLCFRPLSGHSYALYRSTVAGLRSRRMDRSRSSRTPVGHRALALLGALLWILQANAGHAQAADERWAGAGMIAGQPATFILDTGAQQSFVITAADARRFGLE